MGPEDTEEPEEGSSPAPDKTDEESTTVHDEDEGDEDPEDDDL